MVIYRSDYLFTNNCWCVKLVYPPVWCLYNNFCSILWNYTYSLRQRDLTVKKVIVLEKT